MRVQSALLELRVHAVADKALETMLVCSFTRTVIAKLFVELAQHVLVTFFLRVTQTGARLTQVLVQLVMVELLSGVT
jgi:hypothetical protein